MKDVYDRYRMVKKIARRSSSARSREIINELVTIPEDQEIPLTLASPAHRITLEVPTCQNISTNTRADGDDISIPNNKHNMDLPSFNDSINDISSSVDGPWHDMSREELLEIRRKVREERKQHRRAVKQFEDE